MRVIKHSRITWTEAAMLSPALLLLTMFLIVPFSMSIGLAFTNQPLLPGPIPTKVVWLRNFQRIFASPEFWQALWNVVLFAAMVIPLQCGFALFSAILLNAQRKAKRLFQAFFFLPYITPMVVVCVVWSTLYQYPSGLLNQLFSVITLGRFKPVEWLQNPLTALPAITMLSAWQAYGFQMVIYMAGLQNIPRDLYEAAAIDGATGWTRFWKVTWPSLFETNVFILIITAIQALQLFTQVNILTQGGPQGATNTLVHYIYRSGFVIQNVGFASAGSLVLFVLIVSVYGALSFLTRKNPAGDAP
jgi:multiple sugar transport system permease protein